MTLAGPYELSQGGMGLVARNHIYLESGERQIISSNTDGDMAGAIVDEISVPNGTWFFSMHNVRYFMSTIKRLIERQHPFGVLRSRLRKEDLLFRIGGDEFSIVIPDENSCEYYNSLIEQIAESIARPYLLSDIVLYKQSVDRT